MEITNVAFHFPLAGSDPMWVLRIDVEGSQFVHRAAPLVAMVGDVEVEAIIVKLAGDGFVGMLRTTPDEGAILRVGYLDGDLIDTTFTYLPPVVA